MKHYFPYQTAIGILCIHDDEDSITRISFSESRAEGVKEETPVIANAHRQIEEYLRGERQEFDLKLSPKGRPFNKRYGMLCWTYHTVRHVLMDKLQWQ